MMNTNSYIMWLTIITFLVIYLIEITRKIVLNDSYLEFERIFFRTKKIPLEKIDGLFIYSINKKFINKNAYTTKLVVSYDNSKFKFTLSGIDAKAVLNMMSDNFGITENKIFILNKKKATNN